MCRHGSALGCCGDLPRACRAALVPARRRCTPVRTYPPSHSNSRRHRDVSFTPGSECDIATAHAARGEASDDSTVRDRRDRLVGIDVGFAADRREDGVWRVEMPTSACGGAGGQERVATPHRARSGDGTTPAGSFPLGSVRAWDGQRFEFFGNRADPGVRGSYRLVRNEDCWGATPNTSSYQAAGELLPGCASPRRMADPSIGDVYSHAAVIGANLDPISGDEAGEPALAAAIFLHRNSYSTSGASQADQRLRLARPRTTSSSPCG